MSGTDYTLTPNLGLYKPNYDLDAEAWGYHLNANADVLDATLGTTAGVFLPLAGGAMSGPLLLSGDPTGGSSPTQAATKHYVDAAIAAGGTYVDAPSDTFSYGRLNGTWTRVLPLAGGTLSGNITLTNAAPTSLNTLLALNQPNLANGQYTVLRLGQDGNTNYKSGYIAWLANATANLSRMVLGVRGYATGDILTMDGTGAVTFNAPTIQMINGELIPQRLNLGNANGNGLSQTLSGALDHTTSPLWLNYFFSGNNANVNNQNFNSIIVNDSVNYTGNGQSNALYISQVSGAAATRAGGLWVQTTQSAAPTSWRASTAITGSSSLSYNCGGTSLTAGGVAGYTTTLNTYTSAAAGATFLQGLVGYEMDIHALAGSSLAAKTGLYIVLLSDDAVAGAFGNDSAVAFAAGAGSAHGWDYLLNFGGGSTQIPFKPTATLIGCFEPQTPSTGQALAAWGVDLSSVLFSGGFARSLGFLVDGSGNTTGQTFNMSNWSFTPSSTGLTVDVAGQRSSLPSIAAGGSNWVAGDKVTTAYGGVYQITAVSGGVATAVTQLVSGVSASPPANPVTTTATNATAFHPGGSGLTLNLTWTAANTLTLNPSGGPINYTATGGTVARSAQARAAESVNVKDFGAVGDGVTDDSAAINAALNYIRAHLIAGGHTPFRLVFPYARYVVKSPLNFTGLAQIDGGVIDGQGSEIWAQHTGIVIDCLGSRWLRFRDLAVFGDPTIIPRIGIQIGRSGAQSADYHNFYNVQVWGSFSFTAYYNFASETCAHYSSAFRNDQTGANKFCMVLDGLNHWNATSTFVTQTNPTETLASFNENLFSSCTWQGSGNNGTVWLGFTARHRYTSCYASCTAGSIFTIYQQSGGAAASSQLTIDCHCETAGLQWAFLFTAAAGQTSSYVIGLEFFDHSCQAASSVFAIDAGSSLTAVELRRAKLNVYIGSPGTGTMFDVPSKWSVEAEYAALGTGLGSTLPALWVGPVLNYSNPAVSFETLFKWGSTARPSAVPLGTIGYASDTNTFEWYDNTGWHSWLSTLGGTVTGTVTFAGPVTVSSAAGLTVNGPTIRSGTGAATGTQPSGSFWIRTDGTAGSRIYVSQGGGTWVAVASV